MLPETVLFDISDGATLHIIQKRADVLDVEMGELMPAREPQRRRPPASQT